jgi:NAD(P)H-dependent flavin oxidoreductase YrpB (nitropropane dioxygenase family)
MARGQAADLRVDVQNATAEDDFSSRFDPATWGANNLDGPTIPATLQRPAFLAVVSSATLALTLARKSNGRVDGFIVEGSVAGGHNAPPRGPLQLSPGGEPIYGQRDIVDLQKITEIGLPFYLAGGFSTPDQLSAARQLGAAGIQVGTAFAFCRESGIRDDLKTQVLQSVQAGRAEVFTDPLASPTGFPFKVLQLPQSLSSADMYARRTRRCDLGYLREIYRRHDGQAGYRCAAEPVETYMDKGGLQSHTVGRKCLCNALFATVGLGQTDAAGICEPPIVTAGDDVAQISRYLRPGSTSYSAADVLDFILAPSSPPIVHDCPAS